MSLERISERRARQARIGAAACFLFTGVISASWASRVPAIKDGLGLSDGQFAIALLGLEGGAVIGLQLGGLVVPRTGSRRALIASLLAFSAALLGPAVAPSLLVLAASLFLFAALNSVVDVAMNAQGVAVQRLMGRPVLSGMHAMHSLGGCPRCRSGCPCCPPWRYTAATLPRLCGGCRGGGPRCLVSVAALTGRCKGGTVGRRSSSREWFEAVV